MESELKFLKKYLERILNDPDYITVIDNRTYIDTKILREDLDCIYQDLRKGE